MLMACCNMVSQADGAVGAGAGLCMGQQLGASVL